MADTDLEETDPLFHMTGAELVAEMRKRDSQNELDDQEDENLATQALDGVAYILDRAPAVKIRMGNSVSKRTVMSIFCALVQRRVVGAGALKSEDTGNYSYVKDSATATGVFELTDEELAQLVGLSSVPFTIGAGLSAGMRAGLD